MTFSAVAIFVIGLVAAVVLVIALWAFGTANRLDRLHVRTDLAWQALDSALARRAVVARAISAATTADISSSSRNLALVADRAERADRSDRESVENSVSTALSGLDSRALPPQLVAELADAEARVLIARRFHNDAVRDTLALRGRRSVRWLHLGGTAPLPTYFEISERSSSAVFGSEERATPRTSARVVLLDERGRVLLLRGCDPAKPTNFFWWTVGGGVEPGETLRTAAAREVFEETGLVVTAEELRGPMWRRVATFPYDGILIRSEELFFAYRTAEFDPVHAGFTELERRSVTGHRWCDRDDIRSLAAIGEAVFPQDLAEMLDEVNIVVASRAEPEVRAIR